MPAPNTLSDIFGRFEDGINGCWVWTGPTRKTGDGVVNLNGKEHRLQRFMYELGVKPIPQGFWVIHQDHPSCGDECPHQLCGNPTHLLAVPPRESVLKGNGMGARHARRDRCSKGHPYTEDNLGVATNHRFCLTCARENSRNRRGTSLVGPAVPKGPRPLCAKGHLFNEANAYVDKKGKRHCRQCHANRERQRRQLRSRRGQSGVAFSDHDIFERDSWTCQIEECLRPEGRAIPRDRLHPDPWSAQLDHIIPLSKNGPDVWDNVRASHFRCNNVKGARVLVLSVNQEGELTP